METIHGVRSNAVHHTRIVRMLSVVAVVATLAAATSAALADQAPAAVSDSQYLAGPDTTADCTEQLAQITTPRQQSTPPLAGMVALHNDSVGYNLWRPAGWSSMDSGNGSGGIYLAPEGQGAPAHFSISVFDTGKELSGADVPALSERFSQAMSENPGAELEWQGHGWSGDVLSFGAMYVYRYGDTQAKRWEQWLYAGTKVYFLTAEASSAQEYDRLAPSFLAMMLTFGTEQQAQQMAQNACFA